MISRRGLITGLISLVAAPAIVRAGNLMRCSPTEIPLEVNVRWDYDTLTSQQILDDVRQAIAAAYNIPARMLLGEPSLSGDTATMVARQVQEYYEMSAREYYASIDKFLS